MNKRLILIAMAAVIIGTSIFLVIDQKQPRNDGTTLDFIEPLFVTRARAEGNWLSEYLDDEAGLAAWVRGDLIDLTDVEPLLNVEYTTDDYIIGGLQQALPGYSEAESPHIYANVDGWIMAYYPHDYVASKIVDIVYFRSARIIRTKLQVAIDIVTAAVGSPILSAKYYDFRYINATNMMTIAETDIVDGESVFYLEVPSEYTIYEYSYSIYGDGDGAVAINRMLINDVEFVRCYPYCYGLIPPDNLPFDISTKISFNDEGAVTILYRETP